MQEFSKIVCEEIITSPYFFHLRKIYGQSNAEWHRDEIIDRNNKLDISVSTGGPHRIQAT